MAEVICIVDDGDDDIQITGGTPPPPRNTAYSTTPPPRNTSYASNNSSSSSTTSSNKRRRTKPVTDPRLLNQSDWQIQDGMRDIDRSRASTMSLASVVSDAPSPRSIGSSTPPSPLRSPSKPARSYILIDSSSPEGPDAPVTSSSAASTGEKPDKPQHTLQDIFHGLQHQTSPLARRSGSLGHGSIQLPIRGGSDSSNNSKSSRASSGLSEPPDSRGQSFATYQAEIRNDGLRSPQGFAGLTLNEKPARMTEFDNGEGLLIDLSGDSDEDEEDEVRIVSASPTRQVTPERPQPAFSSSPVGKPFGFVRGQGVPFDVEGLAAQGRDVRARTSKSPTPPKRKREDAFPDDIDSDEHSVYNPSDVSPPSSSSSSHGGNASQRRSPKPSRKETIETIEIADDEGEKFVEDEDFVDLSDDESLPEKSTGVMGREDSPIEIEDSDPALHPHHQLYDAAGVDLEYDDDKDEVEFLREVRRSVAPTPRPSFAASVSRRTSTVLPYRNPAIVYPLEEISEVTHRNWVLKKGTFLESSDLDGTDTAFLRINHVIHNHATDEITIRGHQFLRTKYLSGTLARKHNEMCRMLEVDEDDPRPWMEQAQIEVSLDACIYAPREINITNRLFGKYGTCTFRPVPKGTDFQVIQDKGLLACRWECIVFWPNAKARLERTCKGVPPRMYRMLKEGDEHLMGEDVEQSDADIRDEWRGQGVTILGGGYIPGAELLPQGFFRLKKDGEMYKAHVNFKDARENFSVISSTVNIDLTCDGPSNATNQNRRSPSISDYRSFSAHLTQTITRTIDLTDPAQIPRTGSIRASTSSNARSRLSHANNHFQTSGHPLKRLPGQKYTYGDAFCGAGGATRGALQAGLKILWGFDKDKHACSSWHKNFSTAAIYEMTAHEICSQPSISLVCDILHMSPPCQFFSPAHTIAGRDDEMNSASLLACHEILRCARPRVVTLEQTFGITHAQFALYFNAVVNMFTTNGYSITYKICQLHHWGLAQRRVRLIIIGAGPGERLPMIPSYTHCKGGDAAANLLPYASVRSFIKDIKRGDPNHNLDSVRLSRPRFPWDGDSICPRAMTCAGGQNFHYDGKRGFTNREFAAIQGFPMEHVFGRIGVKKQIGNAVPPLIAKVLFQAVVKSLEESDGVERKIVVLD